MFDDLGPNLAGRGVVADQPVLNDADLPGRVLVAVPAHERVVDPAAFAQTAKPGVGMGGTPRLRRLPSEAGVSGGGGVVSGGRGFGCWWWRLGCRDGLAGTAGNIEPDVAGGTVKSQAGRDQRFGQGYPNGGRKEPAVTPSQ